MLKVKLANFIAKRVLICCILLSTIVLIWFEARWFTLSGLIFGSAYGVVKFGSFAWIFNRIGSSEASAVHKSKLAKEGMLGLLINQILIFPLLLAAYFLNHWFFTGFVAGILLVPFVLMLNSVTEALKITDNNFE